MPDSANPVTGLPPEENPPVLVNRLFNCTTASARTELTEVPSMLVVLTSISSNCTRSEPFWITWIFVPKATAWSPLIG